MSTFTLSKEQLCDYVDHQQLLLGTATMFKRSAITFLFSSAMVLSVGSAAGAQTADDCGLSPLVDCPTPVEVLNNPPAVVDTPQAPPAGTVAVAAAPLQQTLPVTGSETAALALGGTLLVAAGGALVWRSNKAAA